MSIRKDGREELKLRNITAQCPYCNCKVRLDPWGDILFINGLYYFIAICPNCYRDCKPLFAVYEDLNDRIIRLYPLPMGNEDSLHIAIPQNIKSDYAEAIRCQYAEAYKACMVMCRRVIEAIACDKLGEDARRSDGNTKQLNKLIEELFNQHLITADIKNAALEIKYFGNYGAHVSDDGLDEVSLDDAMAVQNLTGHLLTSIYITPYETQKLRKNR